MDETLLSQLLIALGLGLLVGLQRERAKREVAGIRTFAFLTLLGTLCGHLGGPFTVWLVPAGFLAVTAMILVGNLARLRRGDLGAGITTEIAALLMFLVGALLTTGTTLMAVALGGTIAVLLHWKEPLHDLARRLGEGDFHAIMRLTLVGLVILPVLPDETYGPYDVLNPFRIWLMVTLIVGISLAAYLLQQWLGPRRGTLLGGVLGGLISSTATTASYARRSRDEPQGRGMMATVITIASAVVFGRILFELGVAAPGALRPMLAPLATMLGAATLIAGATLWWSQRRTPAQLSAEPASDWKAALVFGLLYALVLFVVAAARAHLGSGALYPVAVISGLTDVDAITLSTAQLVRSGQLEPASGWRIILTGGLSNLVFKAGMVAVLGGVPLLRYVALPFAALFAAGLALIFLWP